MAGAAVGAAGGGVDAAGAGAAGAAGAGAAGAASVLLQTAPERPAVVRARWVRPAAAWTRWEPVRLERLELVRLERRSVLLQTAPDRPVAVRARWELMWLE